MIINPYSLNLQNNNIKPENIVNTETKEDLHDIVRKICGMLLEQNQESIEKNNKEVLRLKIIKELEIKYKKTDKKIQYKICEEILNKIFGYGILQKYIDNKNITDIRVVTYSSIYIKEQGKWAKADEAFENEEELNSYIRFCAMKNNAIINTENPICIFSDRKNALRLEAGIAPANIGASSLVIRIHNKETNITLEELFIKHNMITGNEYKFLRKEIENMKSFVICGKGGSGKTTLLKALINLIPEEIAITTAEETAELYLKERNIIQRECLQNRENGKEVDLEKLTKHSLVMSNDVIVLGELKGAEANVFFDAVSTGHMGLATVHAESAESVMDRLITLIKKDARAQYYTEDFLKKVLSTSIDVIVFMNNFKIEKIIRSVYTEARSYF